LNLNLQNLCRYQSGEISPHLHSASCEIHTTRSI